jgi:glycosyltransferase involved in cell wall biosynthesis
MVIVEAMACGLPVVATDSGGPRDFVNSQNGMLVKSEDPDALAYSLEKMMHAYATFNPIQIRQFVASRFSRLNFQNEIDKVYHSVVTSQGGVSQPRIP